LAELSTESSTSPALAATPEHVLSQLPTDLPAGEPVDAATVAALAATVRERMACLNAGDTARYLALYSDDAILRSPRLTRLATAVADLSLPRPESIDELPQGNAPGLYHARALADGRVAAVAPPGHLGLPELYTFVRDGEGWLIDDFTPLMTAPGLYGVVGNTLTDKHFVFEPGRPFGEYGYGLTWGPEWKPIAEPSVGLKSWGLILTDGTSIVAIRAGLGDSGAGLADCVTPPRIDQTSPRPRFPMDRDFLDRGQGVNPALSSDGQPLRGETPESAFAAFDIAYRPGGEGPALPYRLHLECHTMASGGWLLGIVLLTPVEAYDAAISALRSLTATIEG
jgi:hypothetical protein